MPLLTGTSRVSFRPRELTPEAGPRQVVPSIPHEPPNLACCAPMNQSTATNRYLVISRGKWDEDAKKEDVQQAIDRFYEWYERNLESGRMLRGSRLQADGKVVSRRGITDGPFAETKELVGGYWFIVASSLDEAAALAAENPCLALGLTLEIRALDQARALATDTTSETPDYWRIK